jgi:hypothetical protein
MRNSYKILMEKASIKLPSSTSYTAQHILAVTSHLQGQQLLKESLPDDFTLLLILNVLYRFTTKFNLNDSNILPYFKQIMCRFHTRWGIS